MNIFKPRVKRHDLVYGFVPHGDVQARETIWHLVEHTGGRRVVSADYGAVVPMPKKADFTTRARVEVWRDTGVIAPELLLDLGVLDRGIAKLIGKAAS